VNKLMTTTRVAVRLWLAGATLAALAAFALPVEAQRATPIPQKQTHTTIVVTSSAQAVNAGDTFTVTVGMTTDTPTSGAQFQLDFDPSLVQITGGSEGGFYRDWAKANGGQTFVMPNKPSVDNNKGVVSTIGIALLGSPRRKGPTGAGSLYIFTAQAKPGATGNADFKLENYLVSDTGDASGTTQAFAGVSAQGARLAVGGGSSAEVVQPTALPASTAQSFVAATQAPEATIERRLKPTDTPEEAQSAQGSAGVPWLIVGPIAGLVIIGGVVFATTRRH